MTTTVGVQQLASNASNVINAFVLLQTDEILPNPITKINDSAVFSQIFQTLGITPSVWSISQMTLARIGTQREGLFSYEFNIRLVQINTRDSSAAQFQGPAGPQGLPGQQGAQGIQGPTGLTGAVGPAGPGNINLAFKLSGEYSSAVVPGFFEPPRLMRDTVTLVEATLIRRTAGSSGTTRVDVTKNGVSVFATDPAKPQVLATSGDNATSISTTFLTAAFIPGDIVEVVLETVETVLESLVPGPEGLTVELRFV